MPVTQSCLPRNSSILARCLTRLILLANELSVFQCHWASVLEGRSWEGSCGFGGQVEHEQPSIPGCPGRKTVFIQEFWRPGLSPDSQVNSCVTLEESPNFSALFIVLLL